MNEGKALRLRMQKSVSASPIQAAEVSPILRVLVDTDVFHLDDAYDYLLPAKFAHSVDVGSLVQVPFGGRFCTGLVIERKSQSEQTGLKFVQKSLSSLPVLHRQTISLIRDAAQRYACSIWDVLPDALPARVTSIERLFSPKPEQGRVAQSPTHSLHILKPGIFYPSQLVALIRSAVQKGQVLLIVPDEKEVGILKREISEKLNFEVLEINSQLAKSERYRNHLKALYQSPDIILGTRNAIFTHLVPGSTIIVFQDGDSSLVSQRNPEWNVRDIALLRAKQTNLVFASFTPTLEIARLLEIGWLNVHSSSPPEMTITCEESEPRFHQVISAGLKKGSVLVTVAASGYVNSFSCQKCRNHALCSCGGRLSITKSGSIECSLCEKVSSDWSCGHCGGKSPRVISRGSSRIAQELGRAFPGVSIISSSGKNRIDELPAGQHLIIATNGAEPVGNYAAAILLDGDSIFNRVGLHAEESARRDWFTSLSMVQPGGLGYISLPHSHPVTQSLVRWSLYPQITQEILERREAHLPPYFRLATVEGSNIEMNNLRKIFEELSLFTSISSLRIDGENSKLLLRSAVEDSEKISRFFYDFKRVRSLKGQAHLKIRLDPYNI